MGRMGSSGSAVMALARWLRWVRFSAPNLVPAGTCNMIASDKILTKMAAD